jgi:hypothetical protein
MLHGVVVLLPLVASPLLVVYRSYQKRWAEMAQAVVPPQPAVVAAV